MLCWWLLYDKLLFSSCTVLCHSPGSFIRRLHFIYFFTLGSMKILESIDKHEKMKYVTAVRMYKIILNLSSEISQIYFYDTYKNISVF